MFEYIVDLLPYVFDLGNVSMALFGIGGSKSKSKSVSESQSTSASNALGVSLSGSESVSAGVSQSASRGTSNQSIAFGDLFSRFFGGAQRAAGSIATSGLNDTADQLFRGGTNFLKILQGGGEGENFLRDRVRGESPVLGEQISALGTDLSRIFSEELLPGIQRGAIGSGTLGGGRQGVAEGLAAQGITREFTRGATELRAADISARDAAARDLLGSQIQASATGLSALPSLFGIKEQGTFAQLQPFERLSAILGSPTVLTQSQQTSQASSQDIARAISEAFSFDTAQSESQSTSRARAKGKGSSLNF